MRNPNGYGSVVCLDKTGKKRRNPWAVKVTVGWEDGKQKVKYIGYYPSKKEALIGLANFHSQNVNLEAATATFNDVFEMWKSKNEGKLTEKNFNGYCAVYRLVPQLHKKKLKDLKSKHLQDAMDSVDRKYATKAKLKILIKQMYDLAVMDDLITKNYASNLDVKVKQEESGKVYTREEITHLWSLADSNELVEDILILIYTGMRVGEALIVNPQTDFHLEDGYFECHGTKNVQSDRPIPIHPDVLPLFQQRKDRTSLFVNTRGQKQQYRTFSYAYDKFLKSIGFDHIVHDTRKTCATILYENNIPDSTIKAILGHKQDGVTHQVYVKHRIEHLVQAMQKAVFPK